MWKFWIWVSFIFNLSCPVIFGFCWDFYKFNGRFVKFAFNYFGKFVFLNLVSNFCFLRNGFPRNWFVWFALVRNGFLVLAWFELFWVFSFGFGEFVFFFVCLIVEKLQEKAGNFLRKWGKILQFSGKCLGFDMLVSLSFCSVVETMWQNWCVELFYFMYWQGKTKQRMMEYQGITGGDGGGCRRWRRWRRERERKKEDMGWGLLALSFYLFI